jgi:hypothetical protein
MRTQSFSALHQQPFGVANDVAGVDCMVELGLGSDGAE